MKKENVYRKARKKAAEKNNLLNDSKNSQEMLGIDKTKLLAIENGRRTPDPEDIVAMADVYDAPELCNYYCSCDCSIGREYPMRRYECDNLAGISMRLVSSLNDLQKINDSIYRILADGEITPSEREEFEKIIEVLGEISYSAESLKLWAKKHKGSKKK